MACFASLLWVRMKASLEFVSRRHRSCVRRERLVVAKASVVWGDCCREDLPDYVVRSWHIGGHQLQSRNGVSVISCVCFGPSACLVLQWSAFSFYLSEVIDYLSLLVLRVFRSFEDGVQSIIATPGQLAAARSVINPPPPPFFFSFWILHTVTLICNISGQASGIRQ